MHGNGGAGDPRIVVEPSGHRLLNHGDTAMLQVAVRRLREAWPGASIGVITADPEGLSRHVPGTEAVPAAGRYEVIDDASPLPSRRDRVLAAATTVDSDAAAAERALGIPLGEPARGYLSALAGADLLVVSGRGGVCDAFHHESVSLLDEIEAAADLGVPVAMMGQGLGPIEHPFLRARAREVLPKVALLALREGRASLPLARALGVSDERLVVTGDDALELVVELGARDRAAGGLGVNLRVAPYAAVGEDDVARVGEVVRSLARELGTNLVGVPISGYPEEHDGESIERIGGSAGAPVEDPAEAIRRAGGCRVLVAGSYHAALFALAQGVPVVGLARSGYYVDKLNGLAERFGTGMTVVSLDAPDLEGEVEGAVRRWWDAPAKELRALTDAAKRQAGEGREAWRRLPALLGEQRPSRARGPLRRSVRELVVREVETRNVDGAVERSALFSWTGAERRVAIEAPAELVEADADASPFLPLALLPAMRRGDDVVIDGPVSPRLVRGAHAVAELYRAWAPDLPQPAIRVAEEREPPAASGRATGLFFSRGVDSTYSAAVPREYPGPIERLLFVRGLDPNQPPAVLDEEVRLAHAAAERLGLPLSVLRTNVHDLTRLFVANWEDIVGAALAAIGLATTGGLHTVVIAPTDSAVSLGPNGTSPVLDPLLSSEATRVVHDSVALRRVSKTLWLAENRPDLLAELRVCYGEPRADNCGRCSKCLLVMAVLRAAGALHAATLFPQELDLDLIRGWELRAVEPRTEVAELVRVLDDGRDPELRDALMHGLAKPMWTYPGPPQRSDTPGFRQRQERVLVSIVRDGLPWPPPAPDAAPPGLGLVRAIDRARGRHVYGVGRVPPGELVGELG
ncbi:MAG TPA: polysaccharide pyruvyl transferase family protein, partial [Thermoleophilaceae bacterium]|nr:polysaccharide pyruvyl transferase family protein [Thermoleophilaceae bacterium]